MRRTGLLGLLLSVLWLVYFCMLAGGVVFNHRHFSPIFYDLLNLYDRPTAALGVLVCFVALLWRKTAPLLRLADYLGRHVAATAVTSGALFAACTVGVYKDYPLSMDEYSAVFQSKVFASGHLTAHLPPPLVPWLIAPGFNGYFLLISGQTGRGIETYWPGFALVLAPFQLLGVPWLCNATLAGLAIFLIHRITLEVTGDRRAAGWAVLFALASSAFWANAISFYSMQAHLTANLFYAWLLLRPTAGRSFAAGLVGALALLLHNPVPHILFAAPWLIAFALDHSTRRRLIPLALGYAPAVVVGLGWTWLRSDIAPATQSAALGPHLEKRIHAARRRHSSTCRWLLRPRCGYGLCPVFSISRSSGTCESRDNRHVRLLMFSVFSLTPRLSLLFTSIRDTGGAIAIFTPHGASSRYWPPVL